MRKTDGYEVKSIPISGNPMINDGISLLRQCICCETMSSAFKTMEAGEGRTFYSTVDDIDSLRGANQALYLDIFGQQLARFLQRLVASGGCLDQLTQSGVD